MTRKTERPRVALALGSGAAKGWAHIGVLETLIEANVPIDIIAGSSAGALVGAALACGALKRLHERVLELTTRQIVATVELSFARGGIVSGRGIIAELERLGISGRIEELPLPFVAVATDLMNGGEVWLRQGDVLSAIHASIAMPGVIAPVRRDGRWLLDGGVINPVPVSAARALGADVIIANDVSPDSGILGGEETELHLVWPESEEHLPRQSKRAAAQAVLHRLATVLRQRLKD